jgi:hypothetical protein
MNANGLLIDPSSWDQQFACSWKPACTLIWEFEPDELSVTIFLFMASHVFSRAAFFIAYLRVSWRMNLDKVYKKKQFFIAEYNSIIIYRIKNNQKIPCC